MANNAHTNDTYQTILSSALHVFSRKGYVESKIEDIAKDAGLSSMTIYRHFPDKRTLFLTMVDASGLPEDEVAGVDALLTCTDIPGDLATLSEEYFKIIYTHIDILQVFMGESCYIGKIKKQAWHIPPVLLEHFTVYLAKISAGRRTTKKNRRFVGEVILSYIINYAVEHIDLAAHSELTDTILANFRADLQKRLPTMVLILQNNRYIP